MEQEGGILYLHYSLPEEHGLIDAADWGMSRIKINAGAEALSLKERIQGVRKGDFPSIDLTPNEALWFGRAAATKMSLELDNLECDRGAHPLAKVYEEVKQFAEKPQLSA